jgi:hypothetical protein
MTKTLKEKTYGSVEKTIDQLLLMASDYETIEKKNEYKVDLALPTTSSANNRDR